MSGLAAIEGELNGIIQEYLEYVGFDATLEKFNDDCSLKGKTIANTDRSNKSNKKNNIVANEMIQLFCQGQRKEFFRRWLQNIPANLLTEDLSAQKLEFELNIHFAIYPLRRGGKEAKLQADESMNSFKTYLENRGRSLSQTTEFLPFFALPYVPNPQNNQGYQQIFSEEWIQELQQKLEKFLVVALKMQRQPKLVEIFLNLSQNNNEEALRKQLYDAEKRTMAYMKKFNKVQADYHNLIGISAELVDSLENTIRGKPVTPEYLQNICNRLFNSQLSQSIDFTRPGTAGEFIRQSLAYQNSNLGKVTPEQDILNLDYQKLKNDLINTNERKKALILQALRWRLTKCAPGSLRDKTVEAYVSHDLFNFKNNGNKAQSIIYLLNSENEIVREYIARLLNTLASLKKGRQYLTLNIELVKIIFDTIKLEKCESLCFQNLVATLQKLSLRRTFQTNMINNELISWLFDLLTDTEVLSDYTIENAVALMMNLCLRTAGKQKCALEVKRGLKVLSDLLGNSNNEIKPYVNGILYSILKVPSIKEHAKAIGLEDILAEYNTDDDQNLSTQIKFIISELNSQNKELENDSDDDNDEDDDDEGDLMEADLDRTEVLKPSVNELFGENLLIAEYSQNKAKNGHKSEMGRQSIVLNRPTTPHQLRQSMFSHQVPINLDDRVKNGTDDSIEAVSLVSNKVPETSKGELKAKQNVTREKTPTNSRAFSLNRSNSVDKRPISRQTKHVVIDTSVQDSLQDEKTPVIQFNINNDQLKSERNVFETRSKLQRTPNQSVALPPRKTSLKNINYDSIASTNSSYTPKYSSFEPRPSSANSNKSKNSSSSGGANQTFESSINTLSRKVGKL